MMTSSVAAGDRRNPWGRALVPFALIAGLLAACGPTSGTPGWGAVPRHGTVVRVVAAENFWGSVAAELGGRHAKVVSIVTNPDTDPHSYEPTAQDARLIATSQLVVENGLGYDPWVPKLLSADDVRITTLDVGTRLGLGAGANPHRWYSPEDVRIVVRQLVADLQHLDPTDRAYFAERGTQFEAVSMRPFDETVAAIRAHYAGTPVGASESIFALLAPSLGLDLVTPPSFLKAISEGTDVTVADKQAIDDQIHRRLIRIYVYNSQNVTPDVQAQLDQVKAEGIPYVRITETLSPANATFEAWQTRQLMDVASALATAAAKVQTTTSHD